MKVIGVIGLNGSGKDEVVNYLNQHYGIPVLSVGDIAREIAGREGVEPTRDNLDEITRRYFTKYDLQQILKEIGFKRILVYPIFKSEYSKTLYIKSIKAKSEKSNKLKHLNFIYRYIILKFAEARSLDRNKGIYLIAKCYK